MRPTFVDKRRCGFLLIDAQEKLFPHIDHSCEVIQVIQRAVKAFAIFAAPMVVTEQYPEGLGNTLPHLKQLILQKNPKARFYSKTIPAELKGPLYSIW